MISTPTINFFREQQRKSASQDKLDLNIFRGAIAVTSVIAIVSVGLAIWWQIQAQQLRQLQAEEQQRSRLIAQASQEEAEYLSYSRRLDLVGDILETRTSKKEAMDFLSLLTQPDIGFDNITYDDQEKQLQFRLRASSVFAVESFLELLRQPVIDEYYDDVQVSNIRRDDLGEYVMDVGVTLIIEGENG